MVDDLAPIQYDSDRLLAMWDDGGRLNAYFTSLGAENEHLNLVSRETLPSGTSDFSGLKRLAAESLAPVEILMQPPYDRYLDIGSGGGFPSFPVLLTQGVKQATLVERTQKKAAALERMAAALDLKVDILPATLEEISLPEGVFNLVTMRLVKLTQPLLNRILRYPAINGAFIYYAATDLTPASDRFATTRFTLLDEHERAKQVTIFYRNV